MVILGAIPDLGSPPTILIEGVNFTPKKQEALHVFMSGPGGVQINLKVVTSDDSSIVALLNDTSPGAYLLVVANGKGSKDGASMDVTLGAVGPQGVQGIQGDVDPQGDEGPQGSQGSQGPQGRQGTDGATGPAGPLVGIVWAQDPSVT